MGFGRFLFEALVPGARVIRTIKNISEEGYIEGNIKTIKETFTEDIPLTSIPYTVGKDEGRFEGKKEGYVQASKEYEEKFIKQAEKFLEQKNILKSDLNEYKAMMVECEQYIEECEKNIYKLTKENLELLYQVKSVYMQLKVNEK